MVIERPTIILRHRRENLKKCSLRGLEKRNDMIFFTYPKDQLSSIEGYVLLGMDGPEFSREDAHRSIFLIDGTWRYANVMFNQIPKSQNFVIRKIPELFETAYPRRQDDCPDPKKGLASVEALFAAYLILGKNTDGILDNYYWKKEFLEKNEKVISSIL